MLKVHPEEAIHSPILSSVSREVAKRNIPNTIKIESEVKLPKRYLSINNNCKYRCKNC